MTDEMSEIDPLLTAIGVGLVANLNHPYLSCNEGMDQRCFTCDALLAWTSLQVALATPSGRKEHPRAHVR